MERETIPVTGISSGGCERNGENALQNFDGVTRVEANHDGGTVDVVVDDVEADDRYAAIEQAGYDVAA